MKDAMKKSDDAGVAAAPIRIVVADDHPVVRFGVKNMLENEPGFEVVGEAEDGASAITCVGAEKPDLVVLDLAMPGVGGVEALPQIRVASPTTAIVLSGPVLNSSGSLCRRENATRLTRIDRINTKSKR